MKFLVTGSAGLVGTSVVHELVGQDHEVYSIYHDTTPIEGTAIHLDLTDSVKTKFTVKKIKPDVIIHLAALTNVDLCESEKEQAQLLNTKSTEILAQEAAKAGSFFVYASTDYIFDGKIGMKKEDDSPNPLGYYGKTKLDGELALNDLASSWVIARTSTPFGIHPKKKTFPIWVKENLEAKKQIKVLTDQYTSPTYIPNLSKMLIEVATRQFNGIFHLAGATRISRFDFAKMIANSLELDDALILQAKTDEMNWKAKRPLDSSLDVKKATEILNEKPQTIQESLPLFIDDLKNT
jgi:dTDP-4-dehydrorhamnose reductase